MSVLYKPESTKIFFSGVESERFMETAYTQGECRHALMSILYIHQKGSQWFESRCKQYKGMRWMIDSGGHSFRKEGYCPKWPDLQWFDDLALKYRDWLLANKSLIDLAVNLDIDKPCGFENMQRWDYDIFRPLERDGVPICYVYHEEYGYDYWLKMCREHEYVGLPGHLDEAMYFRLLRPAMMNGCRVHGFACTKASVLGRVPFATVDSTSWKAGERFGQTFVFEGGKLRTLSKDQKDQRARYKSRWVSMGIDWDGLEKDKAEEVTKVCAVAWADYQKAIDVRSEKLAYWLKTSRLVDNASPDPVALSELMDTVNCPADPSKHPAGPKAFLGELKGLLRRDPETVMQMQDDRLEWWRATLSAMPENDSRPELEAAVRQRLYEWFYKLNTSSAIERASAEEVEPIKTPAVRGEELPDAPTVLVDLPTAPGAFDRDYSGTLLLSGPSETTSDNSAPGTPVEAVATTDNPTQATASDPEDVSQLVDIEGLAKATPSRIARAKACLGLELLFEQHKLKHKADVLGRLKVSVRRQKELRQQARRMADEITATLEPLDDTVRAQVEALAQEAFDKWQQIRGDTEAKKAAEQKSKLALRPQNVTFAQRAAEIGRLGGAPPGNQNARKHGLTSKAMPNLACDNCPHVQVCPQYRAGHVCAFLREFDREMVSTEDDTPEISAVKSILAEQVKRARRALLFETFEGGLLNKEASRVLRDVASAAQLLHSMKSLRNPISNTGSNQGTAKKGGVLAALFGGLGKGRVTDAEAQVVKDNGDTTRGSADGPAVRTVPTDK
jgi:hypothetical protein